MKHCLISFVCLYAISINASSPEGRQISPRRILQLLAGKTLARENSKRCCVEDATMLFRLSNDNKWIHVGTIADCDEIDKDYILDGQYLYVPNFDVVPIQALGGMRSPVAAILIGANNKKDIEKCQESLIPEKYDISEANEQDQSQLISQKQAKLKKEKSVIMQKKRKNKIEKYIRH